MVILLKFEQFWNAELPIVVTLLFRIKLDTLVTPLNILSGIYPEIAIVLAVPANTFVPYERRDVVLIVILLKFEQFWNAELPILITSLFIVTLVNVVTDLKKLAGTYPDIVTVFDMSENAFSSTIADNAFMVILFKFLQF